VPAARGELHRIGEQVEQDLLERPLIGFDLRRGRGGLQGQRKPRRLGAVAHKAGGLVNELVEAYRLEIQPHLAGFDL